MVTEASSRIVATKTLQIRIDVDKAESLPGVVQSPVLGEIAQAFYRNITSIHDLVSLPKGCAALVLRLQDALSEQERVTRGHVFMTAPPLIGSVQDPPTHPS